MIIAISTKDIENTKFDPRFGRAGAFLLHDTKADTNEIIPNPAINASGGAGVQASQLLAEKDVEAVISGAFGPSAYSTLEASEISMYIAPTDEAYTTSEILDMYTAGKLNKTDKATAKGRH